MKMAELHASVVHLPDPAFDTYRLECVVADLRGHHPDDLDFDRIIKCADALNKICSNILDQREVA